MPRYAPLLAAAFALAFALVAACGTDESALGIAPSVIGVGCDDAGECGFAGAQCLSEFPGGYCTVGCTSSSGCPGETVCVPSPGGNVCAAVCADESECRNGYDCAPATGEDGTVIDICNAVVTGVDPADGGADAGTDAGADADVESDADTGVDTAPPDEPNYGAPCTDGAACTAAEDLTAQCLVESRGFVGGYCSAVCAEGIDDCESDALCVATSVGGLCMAGCAAGDECRTGYECCTLGESAACVPDGLVANCVAPDGGGGGDDEPTVGEPCASDEECAEAEYCLRQVPGGYCTLECVEDAECGEGNACADFGFAPPLCVRGCESADECAEGQDCCDVGVGPSCLPGPLCRAGG